MKYEAYRRQRRAAGSAYADAQRAGVRAIEANDWRGMVRACKACDAAYLEGVALDAVEIEYEGTQPAGGGAGP